MYQWIYESSSKGTVDTSIQDETQRNNLQIGYSKKWFNKYIQSNIFEDPENHENPPPENFFLAGEEIILC